MVKRKSSKKRTVKRKKTVKKPAYLKTKSMILRYLNQPVAEEE